VVRGTRIGLPVDIACLISVCNLNGLQISRGRKHTGSLGRNSSIDALDTISEFSLGGTELTEGVGEMLDFIVELLFDLGELGSRETREIH